MLHSVFLNGVRKLKLTRCNKYYKSDKHEQFDHLGIFVSIRITIEMLIKRDNEIVKLEMYNLHRMHYTKLNKYPEQTKRYQFRYIRFSSSLLLQKVPRILASFVLMPI